MRLSAIYFITQTRIKQVLCFKLTLHSVCSVYICQVEKHNGTLIYIFVTVIQQKKDINFQASQIIVLIALVIKGDKPVSYLSKGERCFKTLSPRQLIRNQYFKVDEKLVTEMLLKLNQTGGNKTICSLVTHKCEAKRSHPQT